ncbi:hypothetical protein [Paenibacillus sp. HW567]|uniref:hypothetical protein n=1 Tax=Paenibacillus sp. HW567 TaxID=1034769 RepID=UPI00035E6DFE|nr:hypothetical protein [Paenibacillus sp. HW567]
MKRLDKVILGGILIILCIICYGVGLAVFKKFDGEIFSHSNVPVSVSIMFVILLIGIGITLGLLLESSGRISTVIMTWPGGQLIAMVVLYILGVVWSPLYGVGMAPLILLPINLIGGGISIGFLITRLFIRKDAAMGFLVVVIINLIIISLVVFEISSESLAEFIM